MLEGLEVGMCVTVPFGKGNTLRRGYVTDITEKCSFDPQRIKEVHSHVASPGLWGHHDSGAENRAAG